MRMGVVILPDSRWPAALERWRAAERFGFDTAWTYDHLSWRSLRDGPWLGTVPLLAAVAASTSTLRFGTMVTSPNFRHPAPLAKDTMTLDEISGGRLELGVGAGGGGFDATVLGQPPLTTTQRAARFEEFVDALDVLLCEPASSYSGKFFTAVDSRTYPGCTQRPRVPFTVAASGPKSLRVAARHGQAWVTVGAPGSGASSQAWFDAVTTQVANLAAACEREGRDPDSLRRVALVNLEAQWAQGSVSVWDDFCGRVEELGFTDVVVHWPRPEDPTWPGPPMNVFDEICSRLR
jgi:alkanesulfonate monooxygenase SsuD/methylene tetrahydromethanopterin reductase-like flavin-dependent oxidoreductase (luciferase family)